jgi:hypothetical protein
MNEPPDDNRPARPMFRILAILVAVMAVVASLAITLAQPGAFLAVLPCWYLTIEMASIGITGYGLFLNRRQRQS